MLLIVGQITRPHGIRGEVMVDVRTDEPSLRFAAGSVLVTDSSAVRGRPQVEVPPSLKIETVRPHQGKLLVQFDGWYDRNLVEELRGVLLCVDSAEVHAPDDPDEFLDHHLVGLAAVSESGEPIGEVLRVEHAPAHDLLHVRLADGRIGLVPFVKAIVPEVDVPGGRVVLTPPEGLFDL